MAKDFAFNPKVTKRGLFTLGGRAAVSGAVRSALPAAEGVADPAVAEAENMGRQVALRYYDPSEEAVRKALKGHPLEKHAEKAVRAFKEIYDMMDGSAQTHPLLKKLFD